MILKAAVAAAAFTRLIMSMSWQRSIVTDSVSQAVSQAYNKVMQCGWMNQMSFAPSCMQTSIYFTSSGQSIYVYRKKTSYRHGLCGGPTSMSLWVLSIAAMPGGFESGKYSK
jgi:hypothetical protein